MVGVVAANDGGGSLFGRRTKRERGRRAASEGEERGPPGRGAWHRGRGPGRREEAGGGQGEVGGGRGLSGARHASPLFVLLAKEEDDKGWKEVGWAGQMGWPAGPATGKWPR